MLIQSCYFYWDMKKIHTNRQPVSFSDTFAKLFASFLQSRSLALNELRGGKLVCYANDTIGNAINASGFYELTELNAVFDFLLPLRNEFRERWALDVGANVGNHSIYFSQYFSGVHAFEPHPVTSKILAINAGFYARIVVHDYGLSDVGGCLEMAENPTNLGGSRVTAGGDLKIRVKRLDDLDDIDPETVALVKLDVEGHEAAVLRGGVKFLQASQPVILFEAHAQDFEKTMEEVEIMRSLGYRFVWMRPLGRGVKKFFYLLSTLVMQSKKREFYVGENIEPADHFMIVAVPRRWQALLKVT